MGPTAINNGIPLPLLPGIAGEAAESDAPEGAKGAQPVDQRCFDMLGKGAALLAQAAESGARGIDARALGSAVDKMNQFLNASEGGLESAVCEVMVHQRKQSDDQTKMAKTTIKSHFKKLKQQNKKKLEQLKMRIEEQRKAKKWGFLGKIFKAIGAALSAVSSIFTGPVGIAGAALLVASLVVSLTVKGDVGKWLGMGLSIAAAAFSMGSALAGEAAKQAALQVVQKVTEAAAKCADITSHGFGIGKGIATKEAMEAEASMMEIKARTRKLMTAGDQEREEIEVLLEADSRCMEQVLKILNTKTTTNVEACRA
jgi:hypothetical protein